MLTPADAEFLENIQARGAVRVDQLDAKTITRLVRRKLLSISAPVVYLTELGVHTLYQEIN